MSQAAQAWAARAGIGKAGAQNVQMQMGLVTSVGQCVSGITASLMTLLVGQDLDEFKGMLPTFLEKIDIFAGVLKTGPSANTEDIISSWLDSEYTELIASLKAGIGEGVGGLLSGLYEQHTGTSLILQTYLANVERSGISPLLQQHFNKKYQVMIPDISTVLTMFWSGYIDETATDDVLAMHGFNNAWSDHLKNMSEPLPSPRDLAFASARAFIDMGVARSVFARTGMSLEYWDMFVDSTLALPSVGQILEGWNRGFIDEAAVNKFLDASGMHFGFRGMIKNLKTRIPPLTDLVRFAVREAFPGIEVDKQFDEFLMHGRSVGLTDYFSLAYWNAHWVLPPPEQAMVMVNREMITEAEYLELLKLLDVHPAYRDKVAQLRYIIPPVQDLIRFAVREAFPGVPVDRQYEEFERWSKAHALSSEWANAYWTAHWVLPSVSQVFEMLHRGVSMPMSVIDYLRIADIKEEWRQPLLDISYRVYTRVDVRRMFKDKVLNRGQVKQAYLDLGYNEVRAENMTEWTVRWAVEGGRNLTKADIIKGYREQELTHDEAMEMLMDINYEEAEADYILSLAKQEEVNKERELSLSKTESLYLNNIISEEEYFGRVVNMGYTTERAKQLLMLSKLKLESTPQRLTFGYMTGCYRERVIDQNKLTQWLEAKQYPPDDIDLVIARETPKLVALEKPKVEAAWKQLDFAEVYRSMSESYLDNYAAAGYDVSEAAERFEVGLVSLGFAIEQFEEGNFLDALEFGRDAESLFKSARTMTLSARIPKAG